MRLQNRRLPPFDRHHEVHAERSVLEKLAAPANARRDTFANKFVHINSFLVRSGMTRGLIKLKSFKEFFCTSCYWGAEENFSASSIPQQSC